MALPLTDTALQVSMQGNVTPTIVLEIDGLDTAFGSAHIYKYARIGDPDLYIGDDWTIGGYRLLDDQSAYVSFNSGSTTKITQKLDPSRAQVASVSSMVVSLIDKNEDVSRLVSPGQVLPDVIGRRATVRIGLGGTAYPDDYVCVFRGVIQTVEAGSGFVNLILNNTEERKRASILAERNTKVWRRISRTCNSRY